MVKIKQIILLLILSTPLYTFGQSIMWQRYYPYSQPNSQNDIIQTFDLGYIMAGEISTPPGTSILLIKVNCLGIKEWEKVIDDSAYNIGALAVKQTTDSGFIMTGHRNDDAFLLKTDKAGNFEWRKSYNRSGIADGHNVIITADKSFMIGGITYSISPFVESVFIVKTDFQGNIIWEKLYNDSTITGGTFILEVPNNQYIFSCITRKSFSSPYFGMCYKLDAQGEIIWKKQVGVNQGFLPVVYKADDGIYFGGQYEVSNIFKIAMLKLDTMGNVIWNYHYDSTLALNSVLYKENYGFIFGGDKMDNNERNFAVIKIDINGKYVFTKIIDTPPNSEDYCSKMNKTNDSGFIFVGKTNFGRSKGDPNNVLLVKTDSMFNTTPIVGIQTINEQIPKEFILFQNYPNPFNSNTVIKYEIKSFKSSKIVVCDITGKEIISYSLLGKSNRGIVFFDGKNFAAGIYFYSLYVDEVLKSTKKMIILK